MNAHDDYVAGAGYELRNPDAPHLLVLLHGLGGDQNQPLGLIAGAQLPDFAVLAPDARAHGRTRVIGDGPNFSFDSMVRDLNALVRATGQAGKPTYIAGISMGAAIALRAVQAEILDVRGAAFIRPAFSDVPLPENLQVMPLIADALGRYGPVRGLSVVKASDTYAAIAAVSHAAAVSIQEQFSKPGSLERRIRLSDVPRNTAYTHLADLAKISVPSLVIGALADPVHPLELAKTWSGGIHGSHFVQLPSRDASPEAYESGMRDAVLSHLRRSLN